MKKLYVGNLPWSVDNAKLQELFSKFGTISSATIILDRETNRSRGFGFVEFANDEEADKAVAEMNETDIDGRKLIVNVARPKEERSGPAY